MYSAVKLDGVPLYRLARKGHEVERKAREIEVYSLAVESLDLPTITFTVSCSRGTYVRTLAHDLGELLGCGAHLISLNRTRSGPFTQGHALSLGMLQSRSESGTVDELLLSPRDALSHLQECILSDQGRERVIHGIPPLTDDFIGSDWEASFAGEQLRLLWNGKLLAVAECLDANLRSQGKNLRLIRVFNQV
jgi:tRNA pseudouridine55 synthase